MFEWKFAKMPDDSGEMPDDSGEMPGHSGEMPGHSGNCDYDHRSERDRLSGDIRQVWFLYFVFECLFSTLSVVSFILQYINVAE